MSPFTRSSCSSHSFSQHIVVLQTYYSVSNILVSVLLTSVFSSLVAACLTPTPSPSRSSSFQSQVSFRYHCQLYSEWRRTNQKVRLLMPDMKGAHTTQRSVPTKSTKKMTDETIV